MNALARLSRPFAAATLILASCVTGTASAQTTAYPLVDPGVVQKIQIPAPSSASRITARDIDQVAGQYALSNGWRLKVEARSSGILARIDRQRPVHLLAITKEKYVSLDGNISMEFDTASDDGDMRMSYVPADARTAQLVVVSARMAQR